MQVFQNKSLQRVLFMAIVLVVAVSFTAVAQAGGPDSSTPETPQQESIPELANCIVGVVWYDGNRNGSIDANSEDPMDGASVTLLGVAPFKNETGPYRLVSHQITRDAGYYEFCNLKPGTYELRVKPNENLVVFTFPVHFLNGTIDFYVAPYEGNVKYWLVPTTGNNPLQIELEKDGYAIVDVGFGLP